MKKSKDFGENTFNLYPLGNEELFVELSSEEGAAISGGFDYTFRNRSSAIYPFQFNGANFEVGPLSERTISSPFGSAAIAYDQKIGPGYELTALVVQPGVTTIDEGNSRFIVIPALIAGGTPPAAASPSPVPAAASLDFIV